MILIYLEAILSLFFNLLTSSTPSSNISPSETLITLSSSSSSSSSLLGESPINSDSLISSPSSSENRNLINVPHHIKQYNTYSDYKREGLLGSASFGHPFNLLRKHFYSEIQLYSSWSELQRNIRPLLERLFILLYPEQPVDGANLVKIIPNKLLYNACSRDYKLSVLYVLLTMQEPQECLEMFSEFVLDFTNIILEFDNLMDTLKIFLDPKACNWYIIRYSNSFNHFQERTRNFQKLHNKGSETAVNLTKPVNITIQQYELLSSTHLVIKHLYRSSKSDIFRAYEKILNLVSGNELTTVKAVLEHMKKCFIQSMLDASIASQAFDELESNHSLFGITFAQNSSDNDNGGADTRSLENMHIFNKPFLQPFPTSLGEIEQFLRKPYTMSLPNLFSILFMWSSFGNIPVSTIAICFLERIKFPNYRKIVKDMEVFELFMPKKKQDKLYGRLFMKHEDVYYLDHYDVFAVDVVEWAWDQFRVDLSELIYEYQEYDKLLLHLDYINFEWGCLCREESLNGYIECISKFSRLLEALNSHYFGNIEELTSMYSQIKQVRPFIEQLSSRQRNQLKYYKIIVIVMASFRIRDDEREAEYLRRIKIAFIEHQIRPNVRIDDLVTFVLTVTDFSIKEECQDIFECLTSIKDERGDYLYPPFPKSLDAIPAYMHLEYEHRLDYWMGHVKRWASLLDEGIGVTIDDLMLDVVFLFDIVDEDMYLFDRVPNDDDGPEYYDEPSSI